MLNWDRLESVDWRREYAAATPFPHVVIDNAFDDAELSAAVDQWPADDAGWKTHQKGKRSFDQPTKAHPSIANLMRTGCNKRLILWLQSLTGIGDLCGDDCLQGAGLHEVESGGQLGIHVDFNRSGALFRRVNAILYLNRGWIPQWGGELELRDKPRATTQTVSIEPIFNRLVLFEASEMSWHGHPQPLACPDDVRRKSVAFYFYSHSPHPSYRADHSTLYVK